MSKPGRFGAVSAEECKRRAAVVRSLAYLDWLLGVGPKPAWVKAPPREVIQASEQLEVKLTRSEWAAMLDCPLHAVDRRLAAARRSRPGRKAKPR